MKKDKKEFGTMNAILVAIAIFLVLFVMVCIALYYFTGGIPDTLVTCVFSVCGGECGIMGWIKTTKERYRERDFEIEDRNYEDKMQGIS